MNLFCFQSLDISLSPKSKALKVVMKIKHQGNFLIESTLDELEQLFEWATHHIEVNTILLTADGNNFGEGLSPKQWENLETQSLNQFTKRLQKFVYSMLFLPQTIIVNLKDGAKGLSAELSLGADLRLAYQGATLTFNHLQHGITPASGGICLLGLMTNWNKSKNWVLTGETIKDKELIESGLIHETFNRDNQIFLESFLEKISQQAPVQRIQAKRAFLELILNHIEKGSGTETSVALAGNATNDWKEFIKAKLEGRGPNFTNPKNISKIIQSKTNGNIQ